MSIERKSSGYQVRWRDESGRQRARTFAKKVDATRFLATVTTDTARGVYVDPIVGRERFADFAARWAASQDWAPRSRESFGSTMARMGTFADLPIGHIDRLALERLRQDLVDHPYAYKTITLTLGYAKTIMRAAYHAGLVPRDPTVGVRLPRRRAADGDGNVSAVQVPTRAEVLAILHAAPDRYRAAIALGVAGLRIGEVLGVQADRLDLERRELRVDQQLQYVGSRIVLKAPKTDKVRTIVLPSVTMLELRRHLRDHQGAGLLFRPPRGGPSMRADQFYVSAWRPSLRGAGLSPDRFVFHSLRHFCVSSMLAEGVPLPAVAGHLGDAVATVTSTYAHWLRDDRDIPAEVLDRLLGPVAEDVPRRLTINP